MIKLKISKLTIPLQAFFLTVWYIFVERNVFWLRYWVKLWHCHLISPDIPSNPHFRFIEFLTVHSPFDYSFGEAYFKRYRKLQCQHWVKKQC